MGFLRKATSSISNSGHVAVTPIIRKENIEFYVDFNPIFQSRPFLKSLCPNTYDSNSSKVEFLVHVLDHDIIIYIFII